MVGLVVLMVLLFLFKDAIFRWVAEWRIREETGMRTEIGKLSSGFFTPVVTVQNVRLYNTPDFGDSPFLTIPELHLECDRDALAQGRLRISLMRLDVSDVNIVRNQLGQTNLTQLVAHLDKKRSERRKRKSSHWFKYEGIDELNLSLGTIKYVDLTNSLADRDWHLNLTNQVARDVRSNADLEGIAVLLWLNSGGDADLAMTAIISQALNSKPRGSKTNKVHKPSVPE